jgi:hypothetical protein
MAFGLFTNVIFWLQDVHAQQTQNDVFTVTNNLCFWAIAPTLGKGGYEPQMVNLKVTETVEAPIDNPALKDPLVKDSGSQINDQYPAADEHLGSGDIGYYPTTNAQSMSFGPYTYDLSQAKYFEANNYLNVTPNGVEYEQQWVNLSDYQANFPAPQQYYQTDSKGVQFECPAYYAADWCLKNSANFVKFNEENASTYTTEYDQSAMPQASKIVKMETYLSAPINHTQDVLFNNAMIPYGGSLNKDLHIKVIGIDDVIIVLIIALVIIAIAETGTICDAIAKCHAMDVETTAYLATQHAWEKVTLHTIDAQKEIALAAVNSKAEAQQIVLALLANHTISFEQAQTMIQQFDLSWNPLISNCTQNINDAHWRYLNASGKAWKDYTDAIAFDLSWTNWLHDIMPIVVIIALVVILFLWFRKGKGSGPNININQPAPATGFLIAVPHLYAFV